jgi:hypothetical protein
MSEVITPLVGFAGIFAGMLLWVQFTRWVALLYVSGSKEGGDFLGPPKRRLLWATPFLALLHPAPWLVGTATFFAFRTLRGNTSTEWKWFFGGMALALLFMGGSTLAVFARWRHMRHSQISGPNKSLERTREG